MLTLSRIKTDGIVGNYFVVRFSIDHVSNNRQSYSRGLMPAVPRRCLPGNIVESIGDRLFLDSKDNSASGLKSSTPEIEREGRPLYGFGKPFQYLMRSFYGGNKNSVGQIITVGQRFTLVGTPINLGLEISL